MARLEVELLGDSRSLERAFARSEKAAAKFQRNITRAFAGAGIAIGLGTAIDGLKSMTNAASDLNEEISKNRVVFGKSAAAIQSWSRTTANTLGLSQRQALQAASGFGGLFQTLGVGVDQAARDSRRLTTLGADLASFFNTDVQSALEAVRSGLIGEAEPLRRYNVRLSEARVQAEAMAESGKKTASSLTDQEKVLARLNIIFEDTKQAQGDAGRTGDQFAGQMRRLSAQFENLQAQLGQVLIPHVTEAARKMNKWLSDTQNRKKVVADFAVAVDILASSFQGLAAAIGKAGDAWGKLRDVKGFLGHFGFILDTWPELIKQWQKNQKDMAAIFGFGGGSGAAKAPPGLTGPVGPRSRNAGPAGPRGPVTGTETAGSATPFFNAIDNIVKFTTKWVDVGKKFADAQKAAEAYQTRMETKRGWLDFGISRALATDAVKDDLAAYAKLEAFLKERIRQEGRTFELVKDLWTVQQAVRDINKDQARKAREARADAARKQAEQLKQAREAAAETRKAAAAARQAATERRFGWLNFAIEKAVASPGTDDDRRAYKKLEQALVGRIRAEGRTLELVRELWNTRKKIADLNKREGDQTKFRHMSSSRIVDALGLNLSPTERARLRQGLTQMGAGGAVPHQGLQFSGAGARPAIGGGGVVITGTVNVHGVTDIREFERVMTKRAKSRAHTRRGP